MNAEELSVIKNVLWSSGLFPTKKALKKYLEEFAARPPSDPIDIDYDKSCFYFMELEYNGLVLTPERADKLRNKNGSTPLIRACYHGCTDVVVKLLDEYHVDIEEMGSIDVYSSSRTGHPNKSTELVRPLYAAVYGRHSAVLLELLERNAAVNATSSNGETALHAACFQGLMKAVECLVSNGADLQLTDDKDHTCIMHAAMGRNVEVAEYLVQKGQDVNQKNRYGLSALDCSATSRNSGYDYFISCSNVESLPKALIQAAAYRNGNFVLSVVMQNRCSIKQQVDALLLLGSSLFYLSPELFFSIGVDSTEVPFENCLTQFRLALDLKWKNIRKYDKCIEAEESERFTALPTKEIEHLRDVDILGKDIYLIKKQCLLIQGRILGPKHQVFFRQYSATIHILTPVEQLHLNIYALLKMNEFETNYKYYNVYLSSLVNNLDTIPLDLARAYITELIMIFTNTMSHLDSSLQQCKINTDIMENFSSNVPKILLFIQFFITIRKSLTKPRLARIKTLVERFVRWKPSCCNGCCPLHYICQENSYNCDLFKFLLRRGADVNALDNDKNTPLHVLAQNPNSKISVELLLKCGAHIDARNANKETPLQFMSSETLSSIDELNYINLKCLCSRVLKDSGSPHLDCLPKPLQKFVDFH